MRTRIGVQTESTDLYVCSPISFVMQQLASWPGRGAVHRAVIHSRAFRIHPRMPTKKETRKVSLFRWMGEGGFEPPKAVPADLQSVPFGHSGIPPYSVRFGSRRTLGYYSTPVRVCQEVSGKKSELFIRSRRTLAILREICYNEANGNSARRETEVDAWNPERSSISRASR